RFSHACHPTSMHFLSLPMCGSSNFSAWTCVIIGRIPAPPLVWMPQFIRQIMLGGKGGFSVFFHFPGSLFTHRLMGVKPVRADALLKKARKLLERSGMTLDELGVKMGYGTGTARRAVWQLFNKTPDPRLSTLVRLA